MARRYALDIARLQIHQVDLKKGVARFALALKNHLRPVSAEVPFACTATLKGQLANRC